MVAKQTKCLDCGGPVLSYTIVKKRCPTCEDIFRVRKETARRTDKRRLERAKKEAQNVNQ